MSKRQGVLFVISGPSGAGKGTVIKSFFENYKDNDIFLSISATTRSPRLGEKDGENYYFKTKEQFEQMIEKDNLLEWAKFCDNYYGTPKDKVDEMLNLGKDVILEIETQGAMKIKEKVKDAVFIFITPPSFEELKNRIISRNTETMEVIEDRMNMARSEYLKIDKYDYILVNDEIDTASCKLNSIVNAERCKVSKNYNFIKEVQQK